MKDDEVTKHEKRGYTRGYAAGMRRRAHEVATANLQVADEYKARHDRFVCAALQGLLSGKSTWKMGGEAVNDSESYIRLARRFADEAMK